MKILVLHNRYASREPSGENVVVDRECRALREAGVEVERFERSSDRIPDMGLVEKLRLAAAPVYAPGSQRQLAELLASTRPDVAHLHNPYPLLSPGVVRTAARAGVPVVHTVHNYRLGCAAGTAHRGGRSCHDCRSTRTNWPAVAHACYRGSRPQSVVMASALALHGRSWRGVARFLAISPTVAGFLLDEGVPAERVTVRPNLVPDPGPHDERGDGLLFVGRLTEEKGVRLLLDAWARHPERALGPLRLVGDGPLRGLAEEAAARRADVELLGKLAPDQVQAQMRRSAAVVVPSTWAEPFGLVAVEAMANGRPALVTDAGALPELVGPTGGWVVRADVAALAEGLALAAATAPGRWRAARARYVDAFAPERSLRQLLDIYADVIERGPSATTA